MIVITGAAGFIGSVFVGYVNRVLHREDLILVDDFSSESKWKNWFGKKYVQLIDRKDFLEWFQLHAEKVEQVFHLGARTDTTEFDVEIFNILNLNYSKSIWNICAQYGIPLVYASSAATYGDGSQGYVDDHTIIPKLKPLNPYGQSKQDFDVWVLEQTDTPPRWAGCKFFNVYGPNESHKGRMASVIWHVYHQVTSTGACTLFRSHHPDYKDGEQKRDFVYVMDVVDMVAWLGLKSVPNGIYNVGSGKAATFLELVRSVFQALEVKEQIQFIDTPKDIRASYQYFTEADMRKIETAGYTRPRTTLIEGGVIYVREYLMKNIVY